MSKKVNQIKWICFTAIMAALFVALDFMSIKIGNSFKITLSALPIIVAAVCYGPVSGMMSGLIGAFIAQVIQWGLSATTVLWILPAGIRGLLLGFSFIFFGRSVKQKVLMPQVIVTSLIVTVLNTVITYIDSRYYGYPFEAAFIDLGIKAALSIVTAVALSLICVPIIKAVKKVLNKIN